MSRDPILLLEDILEACGKVRNYIAGFSYEQFVADDKTFDAVVREFEIIGEAVKSLPSELLSKEPQIPWREIAGFRDVLSHAYFAIEESIVWDAAKNRVAELDAACRRLLNLTS